MDSDMILNGSDATMLGESLFFKCTRLDINDHLGNSVFGVTSKSLAANVKEHIQLSSYDAISLTSKTLDMNVTDLVHIGSSQIELSSKSTFSFTSEKLEILNNKGKSYFEVTPHSLLTHSLDVVQISSPKVELFGAGHILLTSEELIFNSPISHAEGHFRVGKGNDRTFEVSSGLLHIDCPEIEVLNNNTISLISEKIEIHDSKGGDPLFQLTGPSLTISVTELVDIQSLHQILLRSDGTITLEGNRLTFNNVDVMQKISKIEQGMMGLAYRVQKLEAKE